MSKKGKRTVSGRILKWLLISNMKKLAATYGTDNIRDPKTVDRILNETVFSKSGEIEDLRLREAWEIKALQEIERKMRRDILLKVQAG